MENLSYSTLMKIKNINHNKKHNFLLKNHDEFYGSHRFTVLNHFIKFSKHMKIILMNFINKKTNNLMKSLKVLIDLNDGNWYKKLCFILDCKKICNANNQSIKYYTEQQIDKEKEFYVKTKKDKTKYIVPHEYSPDFKEVFIKWITYVTTTLEDKIIYLLSKRTYGHKLHSYLNKNKLERDILLYVSAIVLSKSDGITSSERTILRLYLFPNNDVQFVKNMESYILHNLIFPIKYMIEIKKVLIIRFLSRLYLEYTKNREDEDIFEVFKLEIEKIEIFYKSIFQEVFEHFTRDVTINKIENNYFDYYDVINKIHLNTEMDNVYNESFNTNTDINKYISKINSHYIYQTHFMDMDNKNNIHLIIDYPITLQYIPTKKYSGIINEMNIKENKSQKQIYILKKTKDSFIINDNIPIKQSNLALKKDSVGFPMIQIYNDKKYSLIDPIRCQLITHDSKVEKFEEVFLKENKTHFFIV